MRVLLLGNTGQLGWEAQRALSTLGEVIALDYPQVDFSRPQQLYKQVVDLQPNVIYNAAAYTAVDKAESEIDLARVINATAPGVLAEAARHLGAVMLHISTDYVFDGKKGSAYLESDSPNPLSVYGLTKVEGERAVQEVGGSYLIFRTSWVYSTRRDSFVAKVLQWSQGRSSISVVSDQVGNPTWARLLAEITAQTLAKGGKEVVEWARQFHGLYHLAGSGMTSRMEWARAIVKNGKLDHPVEVLPALTSDFPTPAVRPLYSALDCTLFADTFHLQLPAWEQALCLAME